MVSRISTFGQNDIILTHMLRNQQRLFEDQRQVITGRMGDSFADFADQNTAIISTKTLLSWAEAFLQTNQELAARLEVQNTALGNIAELADRFHQEMIKVVGRNSGLGTTETVKDMFQELVSLMNTSFDGKYIFGGTNNDTPPVNIKTVNELINLANTSDAFDNNTIKGTINVEDNRTITFGVLADDVALPLMEALRRVLQFDNGIVPTGAGAYAPADGYDTPLGDNQRRFLVAEFPYLIAGVDAARIAEANNGVNMGFIDQLVRRQGDDVVFLKGFVGQLEDIDLAEAVTNMQRDEIALQAALQVVSRLSQISLLNFL